MTHEEGLRPTEDGPGIDRRRFVKGSMGAASIGVAAAAGFGMFRQTAITGDYVVRFIDYLGAAVVGSSPAPRGLPFIPVRVDDQDHVIALPELDGTDYLDRLRYCGHQAAPNLRPGFTNDNILRYSIPQDKLQKAGGRAEEMWWYLDRLGDPVQAGHFRDQPHGTAAGVRWRSENAGPTDLVPLILLKLDPDTFQGGHADAIRELMDPEHDLIAVSGICTHFCCVPGYKEAEGARQFNAWELIYCACHHSRYDPHEAREYTFMLREPRED